MLLVGLNPVSPAQVAVMLRSCFGGVVLASLLYCAHNGILAIEFNASQFPLKSLIFGHVRVFSTR